MKDLLGEVKEIVAEKLPNVPFLQSILTFGYQCLCANDNAYIHNENDG